MPTTCSHTSCPPQVPAAGGTRAFKAGCLLPGVLLGGCLLPRPAHHLIPPQCAAPPICRCGSALCALLSPPLT